MTRRAFFPAGRWGVGVVDVGGEAAGMRGQRSLGPGLGPTRALQSASH
jgi:hypothetical protein